MRERYGDPSEWGEARHVIDNGEGEKHVRVSDAERRRRDWERYVGALRNKLEHQLTEKEAEILRRETLLGDIDAERDRRNWKSYVFALGEKAVSSGLTEEEAEILRRERGEETPVVGGGLDEDSGPRFDIWGFRGVPYDESGEVELTEEQKELNEIHRMTTSEANEPPIVNMEKARQFAIQEGHLAKFEIERTTTKHGGGSKVQPHHRTRITSTRSGP